MYPGNQNNGMIYISFTQWTQERGNIGDGYIRQSGLLPLAEANNIVMVFPQVEIILLFWLVYPTFLLKVKHNWQQGNPNGCWNFWGYLGDGLNMQYATKEGYQMTAVARLVERIANISMF